MRISIHQPAYLPWLGYLEKIAQSDVFVFLDTVQFEKNSFTNRNQINSTSGPIWLTVPVVSKGHIGKPLSQLQIADGQPWARKHIASLQASYRKAPSYSRFSEQIEATIRTDTDLLADLCFEQLCVLAELFELETKIVKASTLNLRSRKSDLILEICTELGATHYLSGTHGRDYLELEAFDKNGIDVAFQSFSTPQYSQIHGDFIPNLACVDYLFNLSVDQSPAALFA
ncbi:WbqC family protein [Pontivivens insulae]|uniref:WbqC-like protein family protein n=1 Tax=Pontivivens insulae TaxID=1639689 RepID=A0A2R8A843_9RHOB|nr:WbqC family protein [Pontivivens insulae]RED18292.1 WbqC-like protein [Pontivivens insulae]SPF28190.1 hypothetical protein POI8812_00488 [Pontivivens insulae]